MLFYLLIFYFLGVSTAINDTTSLSSNITKKIMCYFKGHTSDSDSSLVDLDPKNLPSECEVIVYGRFSINKYSQIDCDDELLKSVTDLNKPVIVKLGRFDEYKDWYSLLGPDGNANDTQVLCDYAKNHNITGYIIRSIAPDNVYTFNENVGKYIIPYIKQLKQCSANLIIGITIYPFPAAIKNPCVYNYDELNDLVDYYEIETINLNACIPSLYNGMTPITKSDHGPSYCYSMEEVVSYLNSTKISFTKLIYVVEIFPVNTNVDTYSSYSQVCKGKFDNSTWCVQTSEDYYNKGKFVREQNSGINVMIMDFDDINNDCGCDTKFNGFKNIIGGYTSGSQTPCQNFDVQKAEYPIQ